MLAGTIIIVTATC